MFKQYVGDSGPDRLFCPLCKDELLIYIQKLRFYRCPKCGEEFDEIKSFTRRKRRLVAPNSDDFVGIQLSQVTAGEFRERADTTFYRKIKFDNPGDAWRYDE
jgi:DNA-directed RNA polymerase subunit RPC12/RpoP